MRTNGRNWSSYGRRHGKNFLTFVAALVGGVRHVDAARVADGFDAPCRPRINRTPVTDSYVE
jgi:hypothetical protein